MPFLVKGVIKGELSVRRLVFMIFRNHKNQTPDGFFFFDAIQEGFGSGGKDGRYDIQTGSGNHNRPGYR